MEEVVTAVINAKDDEVYDAEDFQEANDRLNCKTGSNGFCSQTTQIFLFQETSEWRYLNLDRVLLNMIDNSYEFFKKTYPAFFSKSLPPTMESNFFKIFSINQRTETSSRYSFEL